MWPCLSILCALQKVSNYIFSELVEYFYVVTTANPNCYITFVTAHPRDTVFPVVDVTLELCIRPLDTQLPLHSNITIYEKSEKLNINLKMEELETELYRDQATFIKLGGILIGKV